MMTLNRPALLAATALLVAVESSVGQQPADIAKLQAEAVQRTREYLRINTTNPPGNEVETMRWFARILQQEGIPFDTASSAPGRGNIWARLKGRQSAGARPPASYGCRARGSQVLGY